MDAIKNSKGDSCDGESPLWVNDDSLKDTLLSVVNLFPFQPIRSNLALRPTEQLAVFRNRCAHRWMDMILSDASG